MDLHNNHWCTLCEAPIMPERGKLGYDTCLECSDKVTTKTVGAVVLDRYDNPYTLVRAQDYKEIRNTNER